MSGKATCVACKLVFASDTSFDRHRTGSFKAETRRCLALEDMKAGEPVSESTGKPTEWRLNGYGHWTHFAALTGAPGSPQRVRVAEQDSTA